MTRRLEARYRDEDDEDDVRYDESDCQTVVQIDDWHKKQQEHFAQIQLQSDVSEKIIKKTSYCTGRSAFEFFLIHDRKIDSAVSNYRHHEL